MTIALYRFFVASLVLATACLAAAETPRPFAGSFQTKDETKKFFDENVAVVLIKGERDLHEWADELERTEPQSPQDVWTTFQVCLRAGRDETACKMMPLLFNMVDSLPPETDSRALLDRFLLIGKLHRLLNEKHLPPERWNVAVTFYETFDTIYCHRYALCVSHDYAISLVYDSGVEFDVDTFRQAGWSDKKIKDWLEKRLQNASDREDSLSNVAQDWQWLYLSRLWQIGELPAELKRLNQEARESPFDTKKLKLLLNALQINALFNINDELRAVRAPQNPPPEIPTFWPNLDWLIPTAEQRSPIDAWRIVSDLDYLTIHVGSKFSTKNIQMAFAEQTLTAPLTAAECERYRQIVTMSRKDASDDDIREWFRLSNVRTLGKLYFDNERKNEALDFMLEARELENKHFPRYRPYGLSGIAYAERDTGRLIVETEIISREAMEATQQAYWMERAEYYRAINREEYEAALRRALALFDTPELRKDQSEPSHGQVCDMLFTLFNKQPEKIVAFFRERRDLLRDEPRALLGLYSSQCLRMMRNANYGDEYDQALAEDVKAAWERLRVAPKPLEHDDDMARWAFVKREFGLIVRNDWLDPENDLFVCDLLEQIESGRDRTNLATSMFFPISNIRRVPNETAILLLEKGMQEGRLSADTLYRIGNILGGYEKEPERYKKALSFLEESLRLNDDDSLPQWVLQEMAICWLALGDWRKGETYTIESACRHCGHKMGRFSAAPYYFQRETC